jgi:hypothetical protein
LCLAALTYVGGCLMLGYVFGPPLIDTIEQLVFPIGLLVPFLVLGLLLRWLVRARSALRPQGVEPELPRASRIRAGQRDGRRRRRDGLQRARLPGRTGGH